MTTHNADQETPSDDMDLWYTRCPHCGLIGPASSAEYTAIGPPPDATVDWSRPVVVGCIACGAKHTVSARDLLLRDAEHTCTRCDQITEVPADAAQVICTSCRLYAHGLATRTDTATAATLKAVQQRHATDLRDILLRAKRNHGGSDKPWWQ